jgi:hypothetical protein
MTGGGPANCASAAAQTARASAAAAASAAKAPTILRTPMGVSDPVRPTRVLASGTPGTGRRFDAISRAAAGRGDEWATVGAGMGGRIPAPYTDDLTPGDEPLLLVRARIPGSASAILTFVPLALVVRALDAVRNRRQIGHTRRATAGVGFPLDRRMRILVTTRRLLVWRQRGAQAPERIGTVQRDDVLAARLPFVGGGSWRFVELQLRVGVLIRFQVEKPLADQFVQLLGT